MLSFFFLSKPNNFVISNVNFHFYLSFPLSFFSLCAYSLEVFHKLCSHRFHKLQLQVDSPVSFKKVSVDLSPVNRYFSVLPSAYSTITDHIQTSFSFLPAKDQASSILMAFTFPCFFSVRSLQRNFLLAFWPAFLIHF